MGICALIKAFLLPGAQLCLCNRCGFIGCQARRRLSRPIGIRHSIVARERSGSFASQYCCHECLAGLGSQTRVSRKRNSSAACPSITCRS